MFAKVFTLSQLLDAPLYCLMEAEIASMIAVGNIVLIQSPKKEDLGYVVEIVNDFFDTPHKIIDVFNSKEASLLPSQIELAYWIANHYIDYPNRVLKIMLPKAVQVIPKEMVSLTPFELQAEEKKIVRTALRKQILHELQKTGHLTIKQLERRIDSKHIRITLKELERTGWVIIQREYYQRKARMVKAYSLHESITNEIFSTIKNPKQTQLLELLFADRERIFLKSELQKYSSSLKTLVKKNILLEEHIEEGKRSQPIFHEKEQTKILTDEQTNAIEIFNQAITSNTFHPFLLHGITGSGKTLVYIEIVKKALEQDKTAIILLPEISLSPQIAFRFEQIFGEKVEVIHSRISDADRYEIWKRIRNKQSSIVIGARSALFVPLENIGVIIVDEEHDINYKQDEPPMYHGRDCAVMRAKIENAVCILGSATPSFESFYNIKQKKYQLVELKNRAVGSMPEIKLIDVAKSPKATHYLSSLLYNQIQMRLQQNEQIILLQNRRGFASNIQCDECGHIPVCKNCQISLVLHIKERKLKCHYCDYFEEWLHTCNACASKKINMGSIGTERIETSLTELFPTHNILRMDSDTTQRKNAHSKILLSFSEKKASILLGTQMISKGLDFPDVTLVGVLNADIGLSIPDFRASERVFSLLLQIAGRSGRSTKKGEVYLQIYSVYSKIFQYLASYDYLGFYETEMKSRKYLHYPPYSRLIKILFISADEKTGYEVALETKKHIFQNLPQSYFEISEPTAAVISKIQGKYRHQIFIKQKHQKLLTKLMWRNIEKQLQSYWRKHSTRVIIDVDCQSIM